MFCAKCGNELPDDSRFCSKCGVSTGNYSAKTSEPPKVEQKYKKEYIKNIDNNNGQTDFGYNNNNKYDENKETKSYNNYDPTYGCGYESSSKFSSKNIWKGSNAKKEYSWQVILEIIFTFVIPFIGSFIIYKVSSVFGNIIPSNNGAVGSVTVIGIILLFVISWILWALGKYIGKRLSNETGLVLGIILIIFGITLYIGIPIIIYSREAKEVRIVR